MSILFRQNADAHVAVYRNPEDPFGIGVVLSRGPDDTLPETIELVGKAYRPVVLDHAKKVVIERGDLAELALPRG